MEKTKLKQLSEAHLTELGVCGLMQLLRDKQCHYLSPLSPLCMDTKINKEQPNVIQMAEKDLLDYNRKLVEIEGQRCHVVKCVFVTLVLF